MNKVKFSRRKIDSGLYMAKLDHVWKAARNWAEANGKQHNYAIVEGVAPL